MTTSDLLQLASAIAYRMERRGDPCTVEDAIARAEAARLHMAQLEALRDIDWDDTAIEPPLPVGVSIAA